MPLCLAGAGLAARLALTAFTLAWTHSVEHVRWEEDWQVGPTHLILLEARIKGSGAGMEPPPDARLEGGYYRYRPKLAPQESLNLARSDAVRDYEFCTEQGCRLLGSLLPGLPVDAAMVLRPCT